VASNPRLLNFAWQICVDDKTGQVPLHEFINTPARTACESRFASNSRRTICFESQRPVSTPCRWGSTMGTDRPSPRCRKISVLSAPALRRRGTRRVGHLRAAWRLRKPLVLASGFRDSTLLAGGVIR
jgi:hypothetical protein